MSKINELIKELCPNGVEKVSLGSLMKRIKDKNYDNSGIETVYSVTKEQGIVKSDDLHDFNVYSNDLSNYYILKFNQYAYNPARLNIGSIARLKENVPGLVSPMYIVFELDSSRIDYEYYEHLLFSDKVFNDMCSLVEQGARFRFDYKNWDKVIINLPPLDIQKEIVKVLNKFKELENILRSELEARKSQYEFWRGNVFSSNDNLVKLDDICNITSGGTPSKTHSEYWEDGTIKWLGSTVCENKKGISEVTNYITELGLSKSSAKLLKPGTTLIAMVGATIGKVAYLDYEACTNQNVAGLYPKNINELDTSYLYHACRNLYSTFLDYANGKFSMASLGYIKNLEIPLPDINEQRRIAKLLDKFDTLINNISEGLPAEIELRRQQYNYYRNKLLSFEEL